MISQSRIRSQVMNRQKIIPIFPTIRSLGLLWMKSCIWHSRSWIMHCFLLREHRSQKHFWKQESEKISADLMTAAPISRFSRSWQRIANEEQKAEFVKVIEDTLKGIVENGMDKKALEAGINYHEFRYREADFGGYPKGLMYGLQIFDSWLYDETKPFIHVEALGTFAFLKEQISTGYFEKLIQTYLLDNQHGALVTIVPEPGRTARLDAELKEKLQAYKESLSREEIEKLVTDTKHLQEYQEEPSSQEDLEKIPMLTREDISREIAPIYNEEMKIADIPTVFHEIETNGIGYLDLMFDLSDVPEKDLPMVGLLQAVLGIIDTEHYEYGELFNEINRHTGGIGTSLELYPDVTKVKEKEFRATFEIKGKALYGQIPFAIRMMKEILTASKLDDEKRLKEILSMTKTRLQDRFLSAGHSAAALRAMSYKSPISKIQRYDEWNRILPEYP